MRPIFTFLFCLSLAAPRIALACEKIEFPELKRNIEFKRTNDGGYSGDYKIRIKNRGLFGKTVDLLEKDEILANCHAQDRLWWQSGYDFVFKTYATDQSGAMRLYRYNAQANEKTLISSKFPTDAKYEKVSDFYVLKNRDILFVVSKRDKAGDPYRTSLHLNRYGERKNARINVEVSTEIFSRAKLSAEHDKILFLEPKNWALYNLKSEKVERFGKNIHFALGSAVFHSEALIYARLEQDLLNLYRVEFGRTGAREELMAKDVRQSPACEFLRETEQMGCMLRTFYFPVAVSCSSGDKFIFRRGRRDSPESIWAVNGKTGAETQVRGPKKVFTAESSLPAFCR